MTYPQYGQPGYQPAQPMKNGLGTASLVLGLIAVALCWIPFVGAVGFICGVVGIGLGIAGIIRASGGAASNRTMAIIGTVLSILGVIIAIVVWSAIANAISSATGPQTVTPAVPDAPAGGQPSAEQQTRFEAGQAADIEGLVITASPLEKVQPRFGSPLVCSSVQYENRSEEIRNYNGGFDWKLQNPDLVIVMPTFGADDALSAGELAPGGRVAGQVCFEDPRLTGEYLIINDQLSLFSSARVEWRTTL